MLKKKKKRRGVGPMDTNHWSVLARPRAVALVTVRVTALVTIQPLLLLPLVVMVSQVMVVVIVVVRVTLVVIRVTVSRYPLQPTVSADQVRLVVKKRKTSSPR